MPGKARPGRQKSSSAAKKRFRITGKGRLAHQKASHNHLLQQKSKKQKRLSKQSFIANKAFGTHLKRMLPGK